MCAPGSDDVNRALKKGTENKNTLVLVAFRINKLIATISVNTFTVHNNDFLGQTDNFIIL